LWSPIVISGLSREFYLSSVEWKSLLFFLGLFIMIGALVRTGVISGLAHAASHITRGDAWTATVLILGVSFTLGSFINNVPYAATMTPVVGHMAASIQRTPAPVCCGGPCYWAPSSAATSPPWEPARISSRSGSRNAPAIRCLLGIHPTGVVVTGVSFLLSLGYLWVRYFALS
jgi:di/tricarboxylate transporter